MRMLTRLLVAAVLLCAASGAHAAAAPAPAPAAAPAGDAVDLTKGPQPSEAKAMLGLDLSPMGDWKPTWDADAKVAKWENEAFMSSVVIRVVKDKLDNVKDLKAAAPMMMQLGSAMDKEEKTKLGWYAIVKGESSHDLIYVFKYKTALVCSASLKADMGEGIKLEDALKLCESIKVKK